jgi:hypothetical protein
VVGLLPLFALALTGLALVAPILALVALSRASRLQRRVIRRTCGRIGRDDDGGVAWDVEPRSVACRLRSVDADSEQHCA